MPNVKIVLSLGIARGDSEELNKKVTECNVMLQHMYFYHDFVTLCSNNALGIHGYPNMRFLINDQVHLNQPGLKIFASNLKYGIRKALNLENTKTENKNQPNSPRQYNRSNRPGGYNSRQ